MSERDFSNSPEDWWRDYPGGTADAPGGVTPPSPYIPPNSDDDPFAPPPADIPVRGDMSVDAAPLPPPPGGGGGGGTGWGYLTEPYPGRPPAYNPYPQFQAPVFAAPPPFSYKEWVAPTLDSVYADPSYKFRTAEGQRALEQSAAGKGALRTGGSLKDLINYGQNAASQEYSNIFDRSVTGHNVGLNQALGTYTTNYGVSRDVYDRLFNAKKAEYDTGERQSELMNERDFNNFLADFDIFNKDKARVSDNLWRAAGAGG